MTLFFIRFTEKNVGRFYTSGVSGRMKNNKNNKLNNEENIENKINKNNKIEIKQKEIEEETKQLIELETKLEEVKD